MKTNAKMMITTLFLIVCLGIPAGGFCAGQQQININTATATQLEQVKGIGPKTAEKIVAYREKHGKFNSVDQLCAIKGIGKKSIAKISEQLCVK